MAIFGRTLNQLIIPSYRKVNVFIFLLYYTITIFNEVKVDCKKLKHLT